MVDEVDETDGLEGGDESFGYLEAFACVAAVAPGCEVDDGDGGGWGRGLVDGAHDGETCGWCGGLRSVEGLALV